MGSILRGSNEIPEMKQSREQKKRKEVPPPPFRGVSEVAHKAEAKAIAKESESLQAINRMMDSEGWDISLDLSEIPEPTGDTVGNPQTLKKQRFIFNEVVRKISDDFQIDFLEEEPLRPQSADEQAERVKRLMDKKFRAEHTKIDEATGGELYSGKEKEHDQYIKELEAEKEAKREKILAKDMKKLFQELIVKTGESMKQDHEQLSQIKPGVFDESISKDFKEKIKYIKKLKTRIKRLLLAFSEAKRSETPKEKFGFLKEEIPRILDELEALVDDPSLQMQFKRRFAAEVNLNWGHVENKPIKKNIAMDIADRWVLTGPLGAGGMGSVWHAEHLLTRESDAVKTLDKTGNAAQLKRFEQEAKAMAKFQNKGIAKIHDAGYVPKEGAWLAMENLKGESLEDKLEKGRLGMSETLDFAEQLAQAMTVAHKNHIIHRDIKPENVIISHDGEATIIDFGLGKDIQKRKISLMDKTYLELEKKMDSEQMRANWEKLMKDFKKGKFGRDSDEFTLMKSYSSSIRFKQFTDLVQSTDLMEQEIAKLEQGLADGDFSEDSKEYERLKFLKRGFEKQGSQRKVDEAIAQESQRLFAQQKPPEKKSKRRQPKKEIDAMSAGRPALERLAFHLGPDLTRSHFVEGAIMGTPTHFPPEQATGEIATTKADVYSLGVVFYQMSTGTLPIQGGSLMEILARVVAEIPISPKDLQSDIPKEFSDLVDQMLQKDPDLRPEMKDVLQRIKLVKLPKSIEEKKLARSKRIELGEASIWDRLENTKDKTLGVIKANTTDRVRSFWAKQFGGKK